MATIIKSHLPEQSSGVAFRTVAYDLTDMAAEANGYLVSVRKQAAQLIDQAKREAAAIRDAAEVAGRRAAEQAIDRILDEKVAQQMKTLTPALNAAVRQVEDAKQAWMQQWETAGIDLACAIARRIVRAELKQRPELPLEWIRESLEMAAGSGEVTIRLNPADQQTLERQVDHLTASFAPLAKVAVVADPNITLGGCRLLTAFGVIDKQLEAQLQRVKQELS
jgi:flagellar assembly protein FliH